MESGVVLGDGARLAEHVVVRAGSVLGTGVLVDSFAVIGGAPQMQAFDHTLRSGVRIGDGTVVREHVSVHRATRPEKDTLIGARCLLMAGSHVGHDCRIGDQVTLANNVMLAGHVEVGDFVFLGGGAGVHQFVRIGEGAMVGGNASITCDLPPFTMAAQRNELYGLNLVGLRRRSFSAESIADLKECFHAMYATLGDLRKRAADLDEQYGSTAAGRSFLGFFAGGRRGFAGPRRWHEGGGRQRD